MQDTETQAQRAPLLGNPWLVSAGLALLVFATRWPFRTRFLYNWDASNFALGILHFDVTQHRPHPPGYPYFVALGAALSPLTGDANAALVLAAVALEALSVVALYLLGTAMAGRLGGLAAALLLAASVTFWTYGEVALAYPALSGFGTLFALFAYQTLVQGKDRLLPAAAAYTAGTGFRPDLALFLLPLLLACCRGRPPARAALALAVAFGGILLWLVPTALLSGGFDAYLAVLSAYTGADVVERYAPAAGGLTKLAVNLRDTLQYTAYALYAEAAVVLGGLACLVRRPPRGPDTAPYVFLLVWAAPMVLFYVFVHIGDPGYVFSFVPPLLLLGVVAIARFLQDPGNRLPARHRRSLAAGGLAAVLAANALIFLLYPRPLTLPGLRAADAGLAGRLAYVQRYRPEEVMVLTYDSYKQFRYYLPGYPNTLWLDTSTQTRQVFPVPGGVRWVVLTDPSVFALAIGLRAEAEALAGDSWAALLAVSPGQSLVYENRRLRVEPAG